MADEEPPAPDAAIPGQPERRRPAPTIDLKATEIGGKSASGTGSAGPSAEAGPGAADRRFMAWLPAHPPWPLVGAVVAGAVLSLGLVLIVWLVAGGDRDAGASDARLAQLELQVSELAKAPPPASANSQIVNNQVVDDLFARLQKLEVAVASAPASAADPALAQRIAAAEAQLKSLTDKIAALGAGTDQAAAAARAAGQRADANAAALAALSQRQAQPAPSGGEPDAATVDAVSALAQRIAALESGAKDLQAKLVNALAARANESPDDRPARAAAVAVALTQAVERGRPFAMELAAAKSLAADPAALAPLDAFAASGVPTPIALDRELSALEPALLQAAAPAANDRSILEKLHANAEKLIRIRPIDEVAGDDPASVIARLEVRSMRGDLTGALAELDKLPANVLAPAQDWVAKARGRAAAIEASRRFAAAALAALAKPSP
jgi:hypothetical protein